MDTRALGDHIRRAFAHALHIDVPSDDLDLFEAGIIDSLAFVELLLLLEQEFGVTTTLEDLEVENFRSIGRIADFVMARSVAAQGRVVPIGARR